MAGSSSVSLSKSNGWNCCFVVQSISSRAGGARRRRRPGIGCDGLPGAGGPVAHLGAYYFLCGITRESMSGRKGRQVAFLTGVFLVFLASLAAGVAAARWLTDHGGWWRSWDAGTRSLLGTPRSAKRRP